MTKLRKSVYRSLKAVQNRIRRIPAPGAVNLGDLRRTRPFSREFGYDRGQPIDRYYIENFLQRHANDVRGAVLEIGDNTYTRRFGGANVTSSDIWHVDPNNKKATIVGDLANPPQLDPARFDCVILTQTLQYLTIPAAGLETVRRLLTPRGVLLVTAPCITSVVPSSNWGPTWYWGFTQVGVDRLLGQVFVNDERSIQLFGNVLAATAFLYGLAAQELRAEELDTVDPDYQVIIAARVQKRSES